MLDTRKKKINISQVEQGLIRAKNLIIIEIMIKYPCAKEQLWFQT